MARPKKITQGPDDGQLLREPTKPKKPVKPEFQQKFTESHIQSINLGESFSVAEILSICAKKNLNQESVYITCCLYNTNLNVRDLKKPTAKEQKAMDDSIEKYNQEMAIYLDAMKQYKDDMIRYLDSSINQDAGLI